MTSNGDRRRQRIRLRLVPPNAEGFGGVGVDKTGDHVPAAVVAATGGCGSRGGRCCQRGGDHRHASRLKHPGRASSAGSRGVRDAKNTPARVHGGTAPIGTRRVRLRPAI